MLAYLLCLRCQHCFKLVSFNPFTTQILPSFDKHVKLDCMGEKLHPSVPHCHPSCLTFCVFEQNIINACLLTYSASDANIVLNLSPSIPSRLKSSHCLINMLYLVVWARSFTLLYHTVTQVVQLFVSLSKILSTHACLLTLP
jgi:hypothetical protein